MKPINGFAVLVNDVPVEMELSDEIAGGLTMSTPFAIFKDADDAKWAWLNTASLYDHVATASIVPVTVSFGEEVESVPYDSE